MFLIKYSIGIRSLRLAGLAVFLVSLAPTQAELSFLHSEDFESVQKGIAYEGNNLPEDTLQLWERLEGKDEAKTSIEKGALVYRSEKASGAPTLWRAKWWEGEKSYRSGFTIELRVKVLPEGEFAIMAGNGNGVADDDCLVVGSDYVKWGEKVLVSDVDNTDRFHAYRIAQWADGLGYDIWRDGEIIGDREKGTQNAENRFVFGRFGTHPGGAVIDYLRWDMTGPYCP